MNEWDPTIPTPRRVDPASPADRDPSVPSSAGSRPDKPAPGLAGAGSDTLIGQVIEGLEVTELAGRGGMGEVYKAYDPNLDRHVAVKLVAPEVAADPQFVARFRREAQTASWIQHPNVAQIYAAGVHQGRPYYVMEHVEGESLADVLRQKGSLGGFRCLRYLMQAAEGLAAAREIGVVHRDIKPANLMIDRQGRLKIVDFGLARQVTGNSTLTQSQMILGTPAYLAPEQALGREVDFRSDLYALGATFYHLFAGAPPFTADTPMGQLIKHTNETLPPLKERNPRVPQPICTIIERMMAKDPADRFQSYEELLAELRQVARSDSTVATGNAIRLPPGRFGEAPPPPSSNPAWRQPVAWTLGVAVLAVALVVAWPKSESTVDRDGAPPAGDRRGRRSPAATPESSQPEPHFEGIDALPENLQDLARQALRQRDLETEGPAEPGVAPGLPPGLPKSVTSSPFVRMAQRSKTLAAMRQLYTTVEFSIAERGEAPYSLDELVEEYGLSRHALRDAWGREIDYEIVDPTKARLTSAGPDGSLGTADDIVLEEGYVLGRGSARR